MGYFNIFYKITRIIDMLTRRRNRKFILALCLVGAIVFFSPSISKAEFTGYDSQNLGYIYTNVSHIDTNVTYLASSVTTLLPNISSNIIAIRSDADYIYNTVLDNKVLLGECKQQLIDMAGDLDHIDNDIHDLLTKIEEIETKIDKLQTTLESVKTILDNIDSNIEYYGDLNHKDQEELKTILKEYLYGDVLEYPVTYNTLYNVAVKDSGEDSGVFINQVDGNARIIYFKLHEGYHYDIDFSFVGSTFQNWALKYGFTDEIPGNNISYIDCTRVTPTTQSITFQAEKQKYFYIYYNRLFYSNFAIISDYNEGQEQGIYGGMTTINQTTINQGEQTRDTIADESKATRDTITSTDYTSEDVNINSDSINNIDSGQTEGLFTTIFNNFNSAISGGIDEISIPMPNGAGNIILRSDIVSSHIGNLSALISAFWYFIFGFYAFKFVNNLLHNIKDGSILDGFKNNNEVITQDML